MKLLISFAFVADAFVIVNLEVSKVNYSEQHWEHFRVDLVSKPNLL